MSAGSKVAIVSCTMMKEAGLDDLLQVLPGLVLCCCVMVSFYWLYFSV